MFHSRTLQTLFSAIHPRWSIDLGLNWAKHSRLKREGGKEPDYMGENKEFLVLYTKEYLKSHPNINFFIYGHRHIELDLMLSATARILILGTGSTSSLMLCSMVRTCFLRTILKERPNFNFSGFQSLCRVR